MKTLIYLAGLVAVGLAVAWFGFGVHPKTVYYKAIGAFSSASGSAVEHAGECFGNIATAAICYKQILIRYVGDVYRRKN